MSVTTTQKGVARLGGGKEGHAQAALRARPRPAARCPCPPPDIQDAAATCCAGWGTTLSRGSSWCSPKSSLATGSAAGSPVSWLRPEPGRSDPGASPGPHLSASRRRGADTRLARPGRRLARTMPSGARVSDTVVQAGHDPPHAPPPHPRTASQLLEQACRNANKDRKKDPWPPIEMQPDEELAGGLMNLMFSTAQPLPALKSYNSSPFPIVGCTIL